MLLSQNEPALIVETVVIGGAPGASAHFDAAAWDRFVASRHEGTAYHRSGWMMAIAETLQHPVWALSVRDPATGALQGVLPLSRVRSRLFGDFMVAVPFASYGGPLGDADAVQTLSAAAIALTDRVGARLLELRTRRPLATVPQGMSVSTRKLTVTLSLEGGAEATFKRFPAKLRSQVRRSEKDGVKVQVAPGLVEPFHAVYSEHMRDLGTPAMPRSFFAALARHFGDDMVFAIATSDGHPIACGAGFRYGREFEIAWASSLRAYNRISPNMAMYWQLMSHLAGSGIEIFNFGRCTEGSGTHRFKAQWGGGDEVLAWYQWSATGGPAATPAPGGKFALAQQVWTRLPLPVTRLMGPWIARRLP